MQRYDLRAVLGWVVDCELMKCVPTEYRDRFAALVDQANSAYESERRAERAEGELGRVLIGRVDD